jgi:hypothetical protein
MLRSERDKKVRSIVQLLRDKGMPEEPRVMGMPVTEGEIEYPDPAGTVTTGSGSDTLTKLKRRKRKELAGVGVPLEDLQNKR